MKYSSDMFIGGVPQGPLDKWPDEEDELIQEMERFFQMSADKEKIKNTVKEIVAAASKLAKNADDTAKEMFESASALVDGIANGVAGIDIEWLKKQKQETTATKQDVSYVSYSSDPAITLEQIRTLRQTIEVLEKALFRLTSTQNPPCSGKFSEVENSIAALENLRK